MVSHDKSLGHGGSRTGALRGGVSVDLHVDIVDDLASDRRHLVADLYAFFVSYPDIRLSLREFDGAEKMLEQFEPGATHIMLLDICMEGMTGIQLAERVRTQDQKVLIIFLTTSSEYAFDAFPVHPFDYLMKPYGKDRLWSVLREALHALELDEKTVTIRIARDSLEVPMNKICAIESCGHTVEVHLMDGQTIRSIMTFAEIDGLLADEPRFLRCNRGVIVNMDQVLRLEKDMFKMRDGTIFPLRVRNRASLVSQFTQYTISRMDRR